MASIEVLMSAFQNHLTEFADQASSSDMLTLELSADQLLPLCRYLRDNPPFFCDQLTDICGVDYLDYGMSDWRTEETTLTGYDRAVETTKKHVVIPWDKPRFAVIYHLLSVSENHRIRLKVALEGTEPLVPSVIDIWASANWYEREAFDLLGIFFEGHPNLRRILTDYGFRGHPLRKDFPLIGEVEMRYDAAEQRCVYEPVSIQPRVLVPKVIRQDNRYKINDLTEEENHHE